MSSFVNRRCPWLLAVFLLYPALIAASVAFALMMYSSANLCCFKVNLVIFHHLHFLKIKKPLDE
nr:MAG TPA: hypothetical protein [Caudoviricetes sp.]